MVEALTGKSLQSPAVKLNSGQETKIWTLLILNGYKNDFELWFLFLRCVYNEEEDPIYRGRGPANLAREEF